MPLITIDYTETESSGSNIVTKSLGTIAANTKLNVNITGMPKSIVLVDERGYISTNTNPSTGEISDEGVWSSSPWGDPSTYYTSLKFIRTNGNISTDANLSAGSYKYMLFYTTE